MGVCRFWRLDNHEHQSGGRCSGSGALCAVLAGFRWQGSPFIDLLTYHNTKRFREAERFLASLTAEQILICQGYALYNSGLSALLWSLGNAKGAVFCLDIAPTIKRYPVLLREAMKSKVFEELKE